MISDKSLYREPARDSSYNGQLIENWTRTIGQPLPVIY